MESLDDAVKSVVAVVQLDGWGRSGECKEEVSVHATI